jgi:hypothetical protein
MISMNQIIRGELCERNVFSREVSKDDVMSVNECQCKSALYIAHACYHIS